MKTQHCDECNHATMRALPKPVLICAMLHKPRFYAPVYFQKETWGWKRKCKDFTKKGEHMNENQNQYTTEEDTAELMRVGQIPNPLRLAAMLEKTMQLPLHGKSADCLREMYGLLQRCENEMRYAGWDKREPDNYVRNNVYEQVQELLEKNT